MTEHQTGPLLSILITTYNRSFFLEKCLESIERVLLNGGHTRDIEVIVFNNGCTDDTAEVISRYKQSLPLRTSHEEQNIGFVNGLLKLMDLARGRYCWFVGDDDFLTEQAGGVVDYVAAKEPAILLLNHYFFVGESKSVNFVMEGRNDFLLRKSKNCYTDCCEYLLNVRHNNAFFTHIAAVIFRRDLWEEACSQEALARHASTGSFHVYIFLSILKRANEIYYFRGQPVALRVGAPNEAWSTEEGRYVRFKVDVEYFTAMFRDVFSEEELVRHFKDVMLKKSVAVLVMGSKIRSRFSFDFYRRLFGLLYGNYKWHPFFWYGIVPMIVTPRAVYLLLYNKFLKRS